MNNVAMDALERAWRYGAGTTINRNGRVFRPSEASRLLLALGRLLPHR